MVFPGVRHAGTMLLTDQSVLIADIAPDSMESGANIVQQLHGGSLRSPKPYRLHHAGGRYTK